MHWFWLNSVCPRFFGYRKWIYYTIIYLTYAKVIVGKKENYGAHEKPRPARWLFELANAWLGHLNYVKTATIHSHKNNWKIMPIYKITYTKSIETQINTQSLLANYLLYLIIYNKYYLLNTSYFIITLSLKYISNGDD